MKQVKNKLRIVLLMALGIIVFSNVLLAHAALPTGILRRNPELPLNETKPST